jgi:hypothetical protein
MVELDLLVGEMGQHCYVGRLVQNFGEELMVELDLVPSTSF